MSKVKPFIAADVNVTEISFRVIVLSVLLTLVLAVSNSYLALKLGILTSASIPAAILSMGILRFFKDSTILENNLVQTAASAGEAVAGGVVYTIPALVIIGFWHHFDYLTNFAIAFIGGVLGVLFSIPLRRILVNEPQLRFPEGQAIAAVLKSSASNLKIRDLVYGGIIGGVFELFQVGFKILANSWSYWFVARRAIFGFGVGFSATMIGAGFLLGFDMAVSILIGAVLAWSFALPITSFLSPDIVKNHPVNDAVALLWDQDIRFLGIGAMLFAGVWTFIKLVRPLARSIRVSIRDLQNQKNEAQHLPRTDKDIPMPYIIIGTTLMAILLWTFFYYAFPLHQAGFTNGNVISVVLTSVCYVLLFGFLFSVITAYFSGMVGVSASPGSSVVIAGILLAAWMLRSLWEYTLNIAPTSEHTLALEVMTIIIGSVVTSIAAIANDNSQDLKVGQLVGATPWKQQLMLLLGVLVSSLIIPLVMQLLYDVYGIAGQMPHANMDVSASLPAPTSALLAAVTKASFSNVLPWQMMGMGGLCILLLLALNRLFLFKKLITLSPLGVAIGMYLPLSSSIPLFIGGLIALLVNSRLATRGSQDVKRRRQTGTLIACGLLAGAALMDVLLTIPFSIWHSPDALRVVADNWHNFGVLLALIAISALAIWINKRVNNG